MGVAAEMANELDRSRLLGSMRPTDEEISRALWEAEGAAEAEHDCDDCQVTGGAAMSLIDNYPDSEIEIRLRALLIATGIGPNGATEAAKAFIAKVKASKP